MFNIKWAFLDSADWVFRTLILQSAESFCVCTDSTFALVCSNFHCDLIPGAPGCVPGQLAELPVNSFMIISTVNVGYV